MSLKRRCIRAQRRTGVLVSCLRSFCPSLPFHFIFIFRGLTRDASSLDERKRDERKRGKHPVNNLSGLAPFVPYLRACAIAMTSSCQPRYRVSCLQPQKAWATTPTLYKDRPVSTGLEELSFSFLFGKSRQVVATLQFIADVQVFLLRRRIRVYQRAELERRWHNIVTWPVKNKIK